MSTVKTKKEKPRMKTKAKRNSRPVTRPPASASGIDLDAALASIAGKKLEEENCTFTHSAQQLADQIGIARSIYRLCPEAVLTEDKAFIAATQDLADGTVRDYSLPDKAPVIEIRASGPAPVPEESDYDRHLKKRGEPGKRAVAAGFSVKEWAAVGDVATVLGNYSSNSTSPIEHAILTILEGYAMSVELGYGMTPDDIVQAVDDGVRMWFDNAVFIAREFPKRYRHLLTSETTAALPG
jgi:hypothetical protein